MKSLICIYLLFVYLIIFKPIENIADTRLNTLDSVLVLMTARHQFNGSVLIAEDATVIFHRQFGFTDYRLSDKLNPETAFHLASVGKTITAIAVMSLVEKGQLGLDDPVGRYLPELDYPRITVRHLLNHTSGLPDYIAWYEKEWPDSIALTNSRMLEDYARNRYALEFEPGEQYSYTSTNYVFLACIVERVSMMSFSEYLEKTIFQPLGMTHSFILTPIINSKQAKAEAFENNYGEFYPIRSFPWATYGGHGIYSTAEDLYKLDQALYDGRILSSETVKLLYRPGRLNDGSVTHYGLGWEIDSSKVYHAGGWMGFRAQFTRYPDKKNTVIMMDNSNNRDWEELVELVENILNRRDFTIPIPRRAIRLNPSELQDYVGQYELRPDYKIGIELIDGRLYIEFPGRESMEICSESRIRFFLKELNKGTWFDFNFNPDSQITAMEIYQRNGRYQAKKIDSNPF